MPNYDDKSFDHMLNHPPHWHNPEEPKHAHPEMDMPGHPRWAPCNDDQLPIQSQVGRGPAGTGYVVRPKDNGNCEEFYLQGYFVDGATGEETLDWESRNISGGWLHDLNHTYRVRPWNDPPTFNMTFIYHKPPCCSWSWTTPAIPYCWDEKGPYPENMVGSGVATLFVRTDGVNREGTISRFNGDPDDAAWVEKLVYPWNTTRENFNAPEAEEEWTVNLTFGLLHGDVLVPNLYDIAEIIGFGATNTYNVADSKPEQFQGGIRVDYGNYVFPEDTSDDLKHYIDENDRWLLDHFHKDLGFPDDPFEGDGDGGDLTIYDVLGFDINYFLNGHTVKEYIDNLLDDIFKKIWYGGDNTDATYDTPDTPPAGKIEFDDEWNPHIKWTTPESDHIAIGNMNLYGGTNHENWIRTDVDGDNDVSAM